MNEDAIFFYGMDPKPERIIPVDRGSKISGGVCITWYCYINGYFIFRQCMTVMLKVVFVIEKYTLENISVLIHMYEACSK